MGLTTDPTDPRLRMVRPGGQNEVYLVLSDEERARGFVRPVRRSYQHVGQRPKYPLRDLTPEETKRYAQFHYVKYEEYPKRGASGAIGRFWTQEQLDVCGATTTMGQELAETYARDPRFYGSTFCCRCGKHLPVNEFVWLGTDESVGS